MTESRCKKGFGAVAWMALVATGACAAKYTEVNLRTVLDEGRSNELAAVAKYSEQRLLVHGLVQSTGLKKQTELRGTGSGIHFGMTTRVTTEVREVDERYPYAVIAPEDRARGIALCFFSPDDVQAAAELPTGGPAKLSGRFQEFMRVKGETVLVLNACSVE